MNRNMKHTITAFTSIALCLLAGCVSTEISPAFKLQVVDENDKPLPDITVKQSWSFYGGLNSISDGAKLKTDGQGYVEVPRRTVSKDIVGWTMLGITRAMLFWHPHISWGPHMHMWIDSEQGDASFSYNKYEKEIPQKLVLSEDAHEKLISCRKHILKLRGMYGSLPGNTLEDASNLQYNRLPYDKDIPGYALLPIICPNSKNNALPRKLACNHGGWQMLNLPRDKMINLIEVWKKENEHFPPYIWCGKKTEGDRIALVVGYDAKQKQFILDWSNIVETDIEKLNKCLKEIGEKPISINIPDNIDWSKYKLENSSASAEANQPKEQQ